MNQTPSGGLAKKLALILGEVGKVPKSGRNTFHNYDYVTENDLVYAVRDKLSAAGIFVFTSVEEQKIEVFKDEQSGKQSVLTQVVTRHTFVDGDTGEQFAVLSQGQGADVGDKGGYKAVTGAMKYFLYKCFMIPTGDDPESDAATDVRAAAGAGTRQTTQPKTTPQRQVSVPRDAVYTLPAGVKWGDVAVHFGKNKGKFLRELEDNVIQWYADSWTAKPYGSASDISQQDKLLKAAVAAWSEEMAARGE